jgi:Subtilase family
MEVMRRAAALVVAGILVSCAPVWAQTGPAQNDSFIDSAGKVVAVRVHLDRVGVVIRAGEKPDRNAIAQAAGIIASRYGLEPTSEAETPLFAYATAPSERGALLSLAARIRGEQPAIAEQAGLVVTQGSSPVVNLMTDELIVQFAKGSGPASLAPLGITVITSNPFVPGQYLMKGAAAGDALSLARKARSTGGVRFAYPNFISVDYPLEVVPAEPFFGSQWHLKNTGASGGTATADARTTFAWDITLGAAATTLQIYELGGFDVAHEDLAPNLWQNAAEVGGTGGVDDDGNGVIDDFNGWNFTPCPGPVPPAGCGNNVLDDGVNDHATSVSGIAASPINAIGGAGACPQCTFAPTFRSPAQPDFIKSLPFSYAQATNLPVVNNSWGGGGMVPNTVAAITNAATLGRGGLGTLIFFAAGNSPNDPCAAANPYVSHPSVIAVGGTSNTDRKVNGYAFGNCIGIMAPTSYSPNDVPSATGTLATTTADRTGTGGYNNTSGCFDAAIVEPGNLNYTNCFGGTSSATPVVSGIAGMMLTVNAGLTQAQVKNALQDTSDKVEDSVGMYATATGFSTPGGAATHGFGRVNAREAVQLVAPVAQGGLGSTDIFIRDNRLDWGNTDQPSNTLFEPTRGFIGHWQSVDIKVDAPPHAAAPTTNAQFEAFADEQAQEGVINKIYVRVRNRGPVTATNTAVKLHWAFAGAGLPGLPGMFWSNFPADTPSPDWTSLGVQNVGNLAYSGASVANTAGDAAAVVTFDFLAPLVDLTDPQPHHYCLFAVLDSTENRPGPKIRPTVPGDFIPDHITPRDNNVTHRNIHLAGDGVLDLNDSIYVWNPSLKEAATIVLTINAPKGWVADTWPIRPGERITLKAGEGRQVKVSIKAPYSETAKEVLVTQETFIGKERVVGGMTYRFRGKQR